MATQAVIDNMAYLFPSWPRELLSMYADEWIETGDPSLALARVRATDAYANFFPGIRRDDGSLRMTEGDYLSSRDIFNAEIESIGLNAELFGQTFIDLLAGDVSPREMVARVESAYTAIMDRAPEIMAFYVQNFGISEITPQAVLASFLDPRVGEQILNRRISIAEIGGQAAIRDFSLDLDLVTRLYETGITAAGATDAFSAATDAIPVLNVLARRHNDPDDTFDIEEFIGAQLLDDPFQRRRMRTLLAQERSSFTATSPLRADRQTAAVSGLTQR